MSFSTDCLLFKKESSNLGEGFDLICINYSKIWVLQ